MTSTTWLVARAGGIVAFGLLAASMIWGLLLASRLLPGRGRGGRLADLHRFLGALAVVFTVVHVAALLADRWIDLGWVDVVVPFHARWRPVAVGWGVLALHVLVAVEVTSLARSRLSNRAWARVHRASFALFWLTAIHGASAGSDATSPVYRAFAVTSIAAVLFLTFVRLLGGRRPAPARHRPVLPSPWSEGEIERLA